MQQPRKSAATIQKQILSMAIHTAARLGAEVVRVVSELGYLASRLMRQVIWQTSRVKSSMGHSRRDSL